VLSSVAEFRDCLAGQTPSIVLKEILFRPQPCADGKGELYYTFDQFLSALQVRMRGTYAWKTGYAKATVKTPGCEEVRTEDIQKWQKSDKVPVRAYEQISILSFEKREGKGAPPWTKQNIAFLVEQYNGKPGDPTKSNAVLAKLCTEEFGRLITENAVKGQVDRCRKKKMIAEYREKIILKEAA
jgi:hypothetical protein